MSKDQSNSLTLLPLLMVILMDVMGVILVLPVLVPLILQVHGSIVAPGTSVFMRDFLYGFSLSLFPMFMFFSTPVLGDLSDKFGRKKILLLCLVLTATGYFLGAIGIYYNNLFLFLFSRVVTGLAAGTQPIASAAIIDLSNALTKRRNLSSIVLVSSIGIIIGPLLGGITAEKSLLSWFSYETPFILAGLLSLLNALLLQCTYRETHFADKSHQVQLTKGFVLFISAFRESKFRLLAITCFCFVLAWSLYYQAISWLFMQQYHYTVGRLGVYIGYIGIIFVFASMVVTRVAERFFAHEVNTYLFFVFLMVVANIGCVLSVNETPQWFWVIFNATGNVVCYTLSLSLFSNLVNAEAQGWIMGVVGAICAITWTIGGLISGPLGYIDIRLPIAIAAVLSLISFIIMMVYKHSHFIKTLGNQNTSVRKRFVVH
jgi:MFS transporter, DHA1 family, tetracycline resistance protein